MFYYLQYLLLLVLVQVVFGLPTLTDVTNNKRNDNATEVANGKLLVFLLPNLIYFYKKLIVKFKVFST